MPFAVESDTRSGDAHIKAMPASHVALYRSDARYYHYKVHGVYKTRARAKAQLAKVRARRPSRLRRRQVNPIESGDVFLMFLGIAFGVIGTIGYQNYVAPKLNA